MTEPLKIYVPNITGVKPKLDVPSDFWVGLDADATFYVNRGLDYMTSSLSEVMKTALAAESSNVLKLVAKSPLFTMAIGANFFLNLGQIQNKNGDAAAHAYLAAAVTTGVSTLASIGVGAATTFAAASLFAAPVAIAGIAGFTLAFVASAVYDGVTFNGVTGSQAVADWAARSYDEFFGTKTDPLSSSSVNAQYGSDNTIDGAGTVNQNYSIHKGDAATAIQKLGGSVWVNDVTPVHSDGQDYSLVKDGASTNINGSNYFISNVMDSLDNAATEIAGFVSQQVGDGINWLTKNDSAIQLDMANWLAANLGNLINGQMSLDTAFISLAKYVAIQRGSTILANSINNVTGATNALSGFFEDAGVVDKVLADRYAGSVYTALGRMAVDFTFNSNGWNAEQYAKSGLTTIASVIAFEYRGYLFGDTGLNTAGAAAAATTLVAGLLNSGDFSRGDWLNLGAQAGIAYGSGVAANLLVDYVLSFSSMPWLYSNPATAAVAIITAIISLVGGKILNSLFGSKKFYDGEFGDPSLVLNSIYQVQQVDDGSGHLIPALVAVNANGSTIISKGITTIIGNVGQDVLVGGATDDSISGGSGSDYLEGRGGNDTLIGADGADQISGGDGNDFISGGIGDDVLFADAGNDTVVSDDGDDFVHLGSGDDATATGAGNDIVFGGSGVDSIDAGDGDDLIEAGTGDDTVDSGAGNDLVFGNAGNDIIMLGDGDDVAFGDTGNDQIYGGNGNDIILGGAGIDILHGENGNDIIDGGDGDDLIEAGLGNDKIAGGAGDDVLLGGMDNDFLFGGDGADTLEGEFGDDILLGGNGADILNGGDGNDWYVFKDGNDTGNTITDSGGANDAIVLSWLTQANISSLALTRIGNDLKISVAGKDITTVVDQFAGKTIETLEISGGKTINLIGLTGTGLLATPAVNALVGTARQTVVDNEFSGINSILSSKATLLNNALTNIVVDTGYQELLETSLSKEFYNGNEITSFKRDRGACGGAYTVYKLNQLSDLAGTEELFAMYEIPAAYNAADYDQVHLNAQRIGNVYNVNYAVNSFNTVAATETIYDYYDAGKYVATTILFKDLSGNVLSSSQVATPDVLLSSGALLTHDIRLVSCSSTVVNL